MPTKSSMPEPTEGAGSRTDQLALSHFIYNPISYIYKYKPWRSSHGWCLSPVPILRAPPPPSLRVAYLLLVALQGSVFRTGGFGLMIMETSLRFHSPFPVGIFS